MTSKLPFCISLNLLLSVVLLAPLVAEARTPQPQLVRLGPDIGFVMPQCVYCPQPEYSQKALKAKISGTVLLEVTVTQDGQARKPIVVKGLGAGLDEKAMEIVTEWKMKPEVGLDGKPVACRIQVELTFKLPQNSEKK